jgi:hypothetical protein
MGSLDMFFRRRIVLFASVPLAVVAVSGSAQAAPRPADLWATVNICDTLRHPDQMGVRASMPGDGTRKRMWMRFRAQFLDTTKNKWFNVKGNGDSGWVLAGSARATRELGWTFSFSPPAAGSTYTLRGVVNFQWRVRRRVNGKMRSVVVRRAQANTKGGFKSTTGADPPGYSDGICVLH